MTHSHGRHSSCFWYGRHDSFTCVSWMDGEDRRVWHVSGVWHESFIWQTWIYWFWWCRESILAQELYELIHLVIFKKSGGTNVLFVLFLKCLVRFYKCMVRFVHKCNVRFNSTNALFVFVHKYIVRFRILDLFILFLSIRSPKRSRILSNEPKFVCWNGYMCIYIYVCICIYMYVCVYT